MDMAARALGLDPVEIRRRNMIADDEFPYRTASGIVWDRSSFLGCLETACREIGYDKLARGAGGSAGRRTPGRHRQSRHTRSSPGSARGSRRRRGCR